MLNALIEDFVQTPIVGWTINVTIIYVTIIYRKIIYVMFICVTIIISQSSVDNDLLTLNDFRVFLLIIFRFI